MASILRLYRFGIVALQSIRALEAVAGSPREIKVLQSVHVFMLMIVALTQYSWNSGIADITPPVVLNR